MDEPARKRRKTASPEGGETISPLKQPPRRPSISSRSYIAAADRQPSPLKAPPRRFSISPTKALPDRSSSPLKEPPRRLSRRPSFASPTKASLARGYAELLQRPSSDVADLNGRANMLTRGKQARAFIMGEQDQLRNDPVAIDREGEETAAGAQSLRPPNSRPKTALRAQNKGPRKEHLAVAAVEDDADLPATPSRRGDEEQFTPRPGLFSSPSKRPPRLNDVSKRPRSPRKAHALEQDMSKFTPEEPMRDVGNGVQSTQRAETQFPDLAIKEKTREKLRLEKELGLLEQQVLKCSKEIAKLRSHPSTYVGTPEEREALVTLIDELAKNGKIGEEQDGDQSPALSSILCSFLPFAAQRIPPRKSQSDIQIASHRPLELDDPLPYLSLFTSLNFDTKLGVPHGHSPGSSSQVYQDHVIDITGPQNLLIASISIRIDTLSNVIVEQRLLQVPHWAERELGAFLRLKAQERDLGNACWAIDSYWNTASKRAEYWHRCEVAFGHLIPGRTSEDTENMNLQSQGKPGRTLSRRTLSRHLGRDTLVLEDRHVSFKVNWKIRFDWTGEAESEVNVVYNVPRVWREADSNACLNKVPETFASLLQSKGAFAATKTMVALLFTE